MRLLIVSSFLFISGTSYAQLLKWTPAFPKESSASVIITCDANKGNKGLLNYSPTNDVFVHMGVITNLSTSASDWKYVVNANFNTPAPIVQTTAAGSNQWSFTINGGLRTFFNITNANERILKIALLFRSGNGNNVLRNADGSDMYVPVYDDGLHIRIDTPLAQPYFKLIPETITKNIGDQLLVSATSSLSSSLRILHNGTVLSTVSAGTRTSANVAISAAGTQTIIAEASDGTKTVRDTVSFLVTGGVNVAALPAGLKDGINYEPGDTAVTLVLFAPGKNRVSLIGDFNNWTESLSSQMNRTPDGNRFWLRIGSLTPGIEYAYQYLVDGTLRIADYYTEKVLDPNNDSFIPASTYPNLKAYPAGKTTGIVSIFQTAKPVYNWQVNNFQRPDKKNLVIYELLIRDFLGTPNFQALKDTLSYLKRLGVNAIEIMPFNEFEGNISWGYNPNFFLAPDKYYGTETAIKQFIDACHQQGIAVLMDMVLNHCMGSAPQAQLYWDAVNNRPAANNPWLNPSATHPFNVGNDFNHEAAATKDLVARVVRHWLTQYKIDGFRWDLSKGFTQTNNPNNVGAWGNYDAGRVATWKRIYDSMQAVSPASYCILEHFAANNEEIELANYGMMLWGNHNHNFNQATMGYSSDWDFSGIIAKNRGWTTPLLIGYQESHDEERLMYKNTTFGNSSGSYTTRDTATALKRMEMAAAFWAMAPGPKMIWQFGELGYPFSINQCGNNTISNDCRTDPKPIRWNFYQQPNRRALFDVYAKLIKLKLTPAFFSTFTSATSSNAFSGSIKSLILNEDSLKVVVVGNFDVTPQTTQISFPVAGTWYSYLGNTTRSATGSPESITLQPGEYYVYTNRNINNTVVTASPLVTRNTEVKSLQLYPNPVQASTQVRYTLPENGNVQLSVVNMQGQQMATVFNGYRSAGSHQISLNSRRFNTSGLPAGMYVLSLLYNKKITTTSFIIER